MSQHFHRLQVKEVKEETQEAFTIKLIVPDELKDYYVYQAGQYLTLKLNIKSKEVRRSYSMSSSPLETDLCITVKRVKKGLVSNYLADNITSGDFLEVSEPEGDFHPELNPEQRKNYFLIGAGSGITPLFSIAKVVLEEEPQSSVYLLYGNRTEESIIFRNELDQMTKRYAGQFFCTLTLSQPKREKPGGLGGLFSKGKLSWDGEIGRIDKKMIQRFRSENVASGVKSEFFICGPEDLAATAETSLIEDGINKENINKELFLSGDVSSTKSSKNGVNAMMKVELGDEILTLELPAQKTILQVLIAAKKNPPYSCTAGACSSCMAKVISGSVIMDVCHALDPEEIEQGYILTCQSRANSEELEITYKV
jgi:ring-1,2-phenylacetyl-CoA epoxidase subunit PaaE